jgi:hypothetical protein
LALLVDTRLLHLDDDLHVPHVDIPRPRRGLQAKFGGVDVLILDTFIRRGVLMADIARIEPLVGEDDFALGGVETVRGEALSEVGLHYVVRVGYQQTVRLSRCDAGVLGDRGLGLSVSTIVSLMNKSTTSLNAAWHASEDSGREIKVVMPGGALAHIASEKQRGLMHKTLPENRHVGPHFVLDLPLPVQFDSRPHRCVTCRSAQDVRRFGPGESSVAEMTAYWGVTDADVVRVFPGVIIHREPRQAPVYMTKAFLFQMCQIFYAEFNARQTRRVLAALYSANALAAARAMLRAGLAPYSMAWQLSALPRNAVLRSVVLKAFQGSVTSQWSSRSPRCN